MMFMAPQPNEAFEWTQEPWGPALRCSPLSAIAEHLFTSANLRLVDDQREWSTVAERLGVGAGNLRLIHQVHGVDVAIARAGVDAPSERPSADIIISDDPAVAIVVRVADCAPILLADQRLGVVGAVHAGWRGTAKGAARRGVEAMCETFGCRVEDVTAAIGPCLGPCCGEMGPEVADEFRALGADEHESAAWFSHGAGGRSFLDMWKANRDQLARVGVPASQIHVAALCTKTHAAAFHSYRAEGRQAGRMAGVIRARR
jgi:polyphenol oxidase